ncbi:MAG: hypothetical protein AAFO89_12435, partial [Planctomycetota bacterium]
MSLTRNAGQCSNPPTSLNFIRHSGALHPNPIDAAPPITTIPSMIAKAEDITPAHHRMPRMSEANPADPSLAPPGRGWLSEAKP